MTDEPAVVAANEQTITQESARGGSLRRAATLTALAGIVHAVLFLISIALLSTVPGPHSTDEEVIAFYSSPETRRVLVVGLYLMPFAGIAFLWFIVSMRLWFRSAAVRARSELFAEVQLVSGIVFLALFLTAAAAVSSTAAAVEFTDEPVTGIDARILPNFGSTLLLVLAMRMAAIFVISSTNLARSSPFIPRWFVIAGYVLGLFLLLSVSLSPVLVLAFPAWIIVLCLLLLERARHIPHEVPIQPGLMKKHLDELGVSSVEEASKDG